jgi:hypothetical protein
MDRDVTGPVINPEPGVCERTIQYTPLPSQIKFHRSMARFKGFSGPIGSGKSQALCQEAVRLSYINKGRMGLLGAPTYPMLRDATQASFFEILDRNDIPYEHNKAENMVVMKDTRSKILFRPVEEFERLRGTNLAWFGIDELTYTSQDSWMRLEGRLRDPKATRLCGFAVWTPKGYDWVYRRFINRETPGYEAILASAYENRFLLEKVPDFYDRLKESYDEAFFEQEVLGTYLNASGGRAYRSFDRLVNVSADLRPDPNKPLLWTLDFNVNPMSSLVGQVHGAKLHVLDEIVLRNASTQEAAEEFMRRFPYHAPGLDIHGDVSGDQRQTTGFSDYDIIRKTLDGSRWGTYRRVKVGRQNPPVRERVALVNSLLRSAAGDIRVYVAKGCRELIKDLEEVAWDEAKGTIDKSDPKRTHLSDALGYLLYDLFRPKKTAGEQSKPLGSLLT